jgi:hypothetical protein
MSSTESTTVSSQLIYQVDALRGQIQCLLELVPISTPDAKFNPVPQDIMFVLDRSGSMSDSMALLKTIMIKVLNLLSLGDRVSIVTFDQEVHVLQARCCLENEAIRQSVITQINKIQSGGSTNILQALKVAIREAWSTSPPLPTDTNVNIKNGSSDTKDFNATQADHEENTSTNTSTINNTINNNAITNHPDQNSTIEMNPREVGESKKETDQRHIILLTDGRDNINNHYNSAQMMQQLQEEPRAQQTHIHCMGMGHVDNKFLGLLAQTFRGRLYGLRSVEDMALAFGDCLGSLMDIVLPRLSVEIHAPMGTSLINHEYPFSTQVQSVMKQDFHNLTRSTPKHLLFTLQVPDLSSDTVCRDLRLVLNQSVSIFSLHHFHQMETKDQCLLRLHQQRCSLAELLHHQVEHTLSNTQVSTQLNLILQELHGIQDTWRALTTKDHPLCTNLMAHVQMFLNQREIILPIVTRSLSQNLVQQTHTPVPSQTMVPETEGYYVSPLQRQLSQSLSQDTHVSPSLKRTYSLATNDRVQLSTAKKSKCTTQ